MQCEKWSVKCPRNCILLKLINWKMDVSTYLEYQLSAQYMYNKGVLCIRAFFSKLLEDCKEIFLSSSYHSFIFHAIVSNILNIPEQFHPLQCSEIFKSFKFWCTNITDRQSNLLNAGVVIVKCDLDLKFDPGNWKSASDIGPGTATRSTPSQMHVAARNIKTGDLFFSDSAVPRIGEWKQNISFLLILYTYGSWIFISAIIKNSSTWKKQHRNYRSTINARARGWVSSLHLTNSLKSIEETTLTNTTMILKGKWI